MQEPSTVRIGVIGAGGFARHVHIPCYMRNSKCRVAAVSDISREALERALEKFKALKPYESADEMLDKEDLDGVSICTPPNSHAPLVAKCARRGVSVLCEKPFALSSEEAERMVEEGRRNGIVLAVGYVLRFFPNLELVKRFLGDGRLGKLHSIVSVYHAKPPKREWARDPAVAGGGVVQDLGSHVIDLHNWLVGDDVVDLTAFTDAVDGCRVDHNAQILLRYANEVSSTISLSWLSPKWVVEHIFTASGCTIKANGEVEATDANTGSAEMYRSGRRALIHRPGLLTAFLPVRTNPMAPYQHEIDDFVSSIIHRRQPRATGLDGLKVTRIIELLYRNRGGTSA